jgi:hypothetical protein
MEKEMRGERIEWASLLGVLVELEEVVDVVFRSEEDRRALVRRCRLDVENALGTGSRDSSSLLDKEGHREALVETARGAEKILVSRRKERRRTEKGVGRAGRRGVRRGKRGKRETYRRSLPFLLFLSSG